MKIQGGWKEHGSSIYKESIYIHTCLHTLQNADIYRQAGRQAEGGQAREKAEQAVAGRREKMVWEWSIYVIIYTGKAVIVFRYIYIYGDSRKRHG